MLNRLKNFWNFTCYYSELFLTSIQEFLIFRFIKKFSLQYPHQKYLNTDLFQQFILFQLIFYIILDFFCEIFILETEVINCMKCNAEVDPELTLVFLSLVLFAPILRKQNLQVTPVGSKLLIIYLIKQLLQSNHSIFVSVLLDFQHTYLVLISFHLIQIDKIPSGSKY